MSETLAPIKPIPDTHIGLVEASPYALLSTLRQSDGLLSVNPVGYTFDGQCFRISTLKSRVKYRNLQADPRASLCIVDPNDITVYIEVRGHVTLEDDPDRSYMAFQFRNKMGVNPPDDLDPPESERAIIVLRPEQVSTPTLYGGRFGKS